jgi:hypothetical protein
VGKWLQAIDFMRQLSALSGPRALPWCFPKRQERVYLIEITELSLVIPLYGKANSPSTSVSGQILRV